MKKFELTQKNMDVLDQLEYLQAIADQDSENHNEYGWEALSEQVTKGLQALGIDRRIARDLGWDL